MSVKSMIQKLVTNSIADQVIQHVAESAPRGPLVHQNPPVVAGWRQHNVPGCEPSWSAPPWATEGPREHERKMNAIAFALRHQLLEHDRAISEHRKVGEATEFVSRMLPGDLQHLPKSVAESARRLLHAEGWI